MRNLLISGLQRSLTTVGHVNTCIYVAYCVRQIWIYWRWCIWGLGRCFRIKL